MLSGEIQILLHPMNTFFIADPFSSPEEELATIIGLGIESFLVELSISSVSVDTR